jgi:hypothetical protein
VVDLEGDLGPVLTERVVRQLGKVDHGVEAFEVRGFDPPQVLYVVRGEIG